MMQREIFFNSAAVRETKSPLAETVGGRGRSAETINSAAFFARSNPEFFALFSIRTELINCGSGILWEETKPVSAGLPSEK